MLILKEYSEEKGTKMIEFKDVTKCYPGNEAALSHVNLKIDDGEFVFVVGESGAGKTTFMKLLLREEKVTSGEIIVDGKSISKLSFFSLPYYRRKLGVVFQDFRLFPDMTVYENVAFAMRAVGETGKEIAKKVPMILKVVHLENKRNRFPASLSGGEQQRVALARALANNPKYIIADEPTGNIDPKMSHDIMQMLLQINEMGKTVIVVTHEQALVEEFHQRVVSLSQGKVIGDCECSAHENEG